MACDSRCSYSPCVDGGGHGNWQAMTCHRAQRTFVVWCGAPEALGVGQLDGLGHGLAGGLHAELGAGDLNLALDQGRLAGRLDGVEEVGHRVPREGDAAGHVGGEVGAVQEHGAADGHEDLLVLEAHEHLPRLEVLGHGVEHRRRRLERVRLRRRVLQVRVLLGALHERVRQEHAVARLLRLELRLLLLLVFLVVAAIVIVLRHRGGDHGEQRRHRQERPPPPERHWRCHHH